MFCQYIYPLITRCPHPILVRFWSLYRLYPLAVLISSLFKAARNFPFPWVLYLSFSLISYDVDLCTVPFSLSVSPYSWNYQRLSIFLQYIRVFDSIFINKFFVPVSLSIRQIQSITVPLVSVTSHILWSKRFVAVILASHYYLYSSDSSILLIGQLSVCLKIYA